MMRRTIPSVKYLIAVVAILAVFFALIYLKVQFSGLDKIDEAKEISFYIPENSSCSEISQSLYQAGLVRGPGLVSFYSKFYNLDNLFKPGRYILKTSQSISEIVGILVKGPNDFKIFTIPEGYTLSQIVDLLVNQGLAEENLLKIAIENSRGYKLPFLKNIPKDIVLEGYLFPDTYHIGSDTTEEQIVKMMLDRFQVEMTRLDFISKVDGINLDLHQAVTIASLIEGEAMIDKERPVIASVIFNRLKIDMPLQIDATVKYALGGKKTKIYYRDLKVDSPYNTYLIRGLPPGPINSPGSASLEAVIKPAVTGYLYYVAKKDGSHAFSSSLQEHNNNISKYQ